MTTSRKIIALFIVLILFSNICNVFTVKTFAHGTNLLIEYDNCNYDLMNEGIHEKWYLLYGKNNKGEKQYYHLSHQTTVIKYYFEEESEDGTYTWTTDATEGQANMIKDAYANSMKKWNNVYFYSYNSDDHVIKHKVIDVVEGTEEDHNLSIYPSTHTSNNNVAETVAYAGTIVNDPSGEYHAHYYDWRMRININIFLTDNEPVLNVYKERLGAHELGHVLGLFDLDFQNACDSSTNQAHHHEVLMGYGAPVVNRTKNITYKDIAGVAITRGFHTDDDHKWLYMYSATGYKLVCSICNGVLLLDNLNGYTYNTYGACGGNHSLSSGNMMAVASYGTTDYYKCRYCRYVAPFSDLVTQDYTISYYSENVHKYTNQVAGLRYTFYEDHSFEGSHVCVECGSHVGQCTDHYDYHSLSQHKAYCECGEYILSEHSFNASSYSCLLCGAPHTHDYTYRYVNDSTTMHRSYCICGANCLQPHVVESGSYSSGNKYALCIACKALVTIGMTHHQSIGSLPHSENGSFILPNGIIVLVDEDKEAYFNRTLEFIYPDDNLEVD